MYHLRKVTQTQQDEYQCLPVTRVNAEMGMIIFKNMLCLI